MKTLKLNNPITVNGKQRTELSYDSNEITAQQFAEADARKLTARGLNLTTATAVAEIDSGLHIYLGYAAILAVNPDIDISDLERIKGVDVVKVMGIGRSFMLGKSEEPSDLDSSDEPYETMPKPSAPQSKTSEKDD